MVLLEQFKNVLVIILLFAVTLSAFLSHAIEASAIAVIGLTYRAGKKTLFIAWDALGIVMLYVITTMILYLKV